jgi:glyoxylase-like metal-dependent hydrolase (beta-lactamase superfamily II)/ferredoxin
MARLSDRLPENAQGRYFVDRTCIDCDTCRQLAPAVFSRSAVAGQSYVHHQPASPTEEQRAQMALVSCPTHSIGTVDHTRVQAGVDALPEEIADGIFSCGYASADSYGASSYLVRRPEGNVLVDSPRAAGPLLKRLEALGGVAWMFLSHRDDVADHARFHAHFGCRRVLHRADVGPGTADVELQVEGRAPIPLADDLLVLPLPGHTRGSAALLYRNRFLFTGDHLWGSADGTGLEASRAVCWYSWAEQTRSMERLLVHDFEWVLPGHGRRFHAPSPEAMRAALTRLVGRMRAGVR